MASFEKERHRSHLDSRKLLGRIAMHRMAVKLLICQELPGDDGLHSLKVRCRPPPCWDGPGRLIAPKPAVSAICYRSP